MSGRAYLEDEVFLKPGASCIIRVNELNFPTGLWWGTVIEQPSTIGKCLLVKAKISGGRFGFSKPGVRIKSDEAMDVIPSGNYDVYPDIAVVRELLDTLESFKEELKKAEAEAERRLALVKNVWEQIISLFG